MENKIGLAAIQLPITYCHRKFGIRIAVAIM
jgi:hypothetical protein